MKVQNEKLYEALLAATKELTEVNIREVANKLGINHVPSNEIRQIVAKVLKNAPGYNIYISVDHEGQASSLFSNGRITCREYDADPITGKGGFRPGAGRKKLNEEDKTDHKARCFRLNDNEFIAVKKFVAELRKE